MTSPSGVRLRVNPHARLLRRWAWLAVALVLPIIAAACGSATTRDNPTGDTAPPNIFPGQVVTEQGRGAASLYDLVFWIAVVVFVLVEGLIILIAVRYRRRATDTELPMQRHGSNPLEILWTVVPFVVVSVLFVGTFLTLTDTEARSDDPDVTIDVTGFQWQWTFAYPEYEGAPGSPLSFTGAGTQGPELVLPVGQTVHFNLHAQDVIHSFYVPQFFYKKDLIPGRVNQFEVTITQEGVFGGQCAEFCGLGHNEMYFTVRAVQAAAFQEWVAEEQEKARSTQAPPPSGGTVLQVTSVSITDGFDPSELSAPADTPITFELVNSDATAPHNIAVKGANPDGTDWVGQPIIQPSQTGSYQAPPLHPGSYEFYCAVHPNMRGTLTVGD